MLGNRTLVRDGFDVCAKTVLVGNMTVPSQLWHRFCVPGNMSSPQCDDYFLHNNLTEVPGIPGLGSGVIRGNGTESQHGDQLWDLIADKMMDRVIMFTFMFV